MGGKGGRTCARSRIGPDTLGCVLNAAGVRGTFVIRKTGAKGDVANGDRGKNGRAGVQ